MEFTYDTLKSWFINSKYEFNTRPFELNLLGIRKNYTATNLWDDTLLVIYFDGRNNIVKEFKNFTTDPGYYFLKTKMLNPKGCAFLKEGQHINMFTIGLHNGKYKALVQYGKVTVYRDANKDEVLDRNIEDRGYFGINLHHGYNSNLVFNNSAGCQVLKDPKDLSELLELADLHEKTYGKGINYTLTSNI